LVLVEKHEQGGVGSSVVVPKVAHASSQDEHGTGLYVPAASQADDFVFDTVFLFSEAEPDVGD
jgi:hypothetical protein